MFSAQKLAVLAGSNCAARYAAPKAARAAYQAASPAMAQALREDLVARFKRDYPSAVMCFEEDFEACIAHLRCPPGHRKAIRTTNLLERLFEEDRRRMKTIAVFFGERPVLKLMYATLIRASETWRGLTISGLERGQLERLCEQLAAEQRRAQEAAKAGSAPTRISSKDRT